LLESQIGMDWGQQRRRYQGQKLTAQQP
jgi:hypothetical protein